MSFDRNGGKGERSSSDNGVGSILACPVGHSELFVMIFQKLFLPILGDMREDMESEKDFETLIRGFIEVHFWETQRFNRGEQSV